MITIHNIDGNPYICDRHLANTYGVTLEQLSIAVAQHVRWNSGTDWLHLTPEDAQLFGPNYPAIAFSFKGCQKVAAMFNTGYIWNAYAYIIKPLFHKEEQKYDTQIQEDLGL